MLIQMLILFFPFDPTLLWDLLAQFFPSLAPFLVNGHGWATTGTMTLLILAVSELVDKKWHMDGKDAWLRSAGIGMGIGFIGWIFNLGMFSPDSVHAVLNGTLPQWVQAMIVGLYATVVSWVSWATGIGKFVLELLKIRPPQETKALPAGTVTSMNARPNKPAGEQKEIVP